MMMGSGQVPLPDDSSSLMTECPTYEEDEHERYLQNHSNGSSAGAGGGSSGSAGGKSYPDYCRTLKVRDANGTVKELVFPKALDLDRPKRARTTFSAEQLYQLEQEFHRNQYLVGRERTDLALQLHLSETQVKVWFQNRRTKYKRDRQREAEERKANAESRATCNILRILQPQPPTAACPAPTYLATHPPHAPSATQPLPSHPQPTHPHSQHPPLHHPHRHHLPHPPFTLPLPPTYYRS